MKLKLNQLQELCGPTAGKRCFPHEPGMQLGARPRALQRPEVLLTEESVPALCTRATAAVNILWHPRDYSPVVTHEHQGQEWR